jgi:hypothetical protein
MLLNSSSKRDVLSSKNTTASTASSQQDKSASSKPTEPEPAVAKGWLKRMEPPKGGTEPPDAKFLAVASVVTLAGFYAWFIDAPKRKEEE